MKSGRTRMRDESDRKVKKSLHKNKDQISGRCFRVSELKKYKIKLNGEYISGLSGECYESPISDRGFYTHRKEMNRFTFGDPLEIEGDWNLKSYIEQIMIAVKLGEIDLKELIVEGGE